ncbi:UNVERIFIED_CONTAM: hypothetical protein FKN15_007317 [Acipenser sinensis]
MSDPSLRLADLTHSAGVSGGFMDDSINMQADDLFARKFKALNGNMGPPSLNTQGKSEAPAMPKMGVRARISEWPPRKDGLEGRPPPNYESLVLGFHNGQIDQDGLKMGSINKRSQEVSVDLEFAETQYALGDIFNRSPLKGLHPIRQRSNSDVTISDIDAEDILDQNAVNPNTGASLHREYGSTSSIDRQGLSGESFFAMLRGYQVDSLEHRTMLPLGFPELLHYDSTFSPSLQTAEQISRGEFVRVAGANSATYAGENCSFESSLSSHCTNAGVSVLEVPRENQPIHREKVKRYIIEHIDLGAYYYHKYFYGREHQNYFGVDENLGPVAVSIRREKLEDGKEKDGVQYNYRITFRTSELTTLRGAILEDAVPSTARHGTARGLPLKEVLEYAIPELNIQCLRLALNSPKVPEQLLKLDEQGLLRKRHIGNDIVTIVFQEPGALPFSPKNIRSHFQHVFVIVKVYNPCTENVCYSVAVSRSKDVPPFGPPIPKGVTFPKSAVFRDFLLAKVINAENAAHKSEKFRAMATRTRQEYLKDLAGNFVTTATVDSTVKFSFITLGAKKKEKTKPRKDAHLYSIGAITWNVIARDFGQSADIECLLGTSNEFIMLIERESKNVVFNCSCRDVIGWTYGVMSIKIFYERGECVLLSALDNCDEDIREIVLRLEELYNGMDRGCSELYRIPMVEYKLDSEGTPCEYKTPFRRNTTWHRVPTPGGLPVLRASPIQGPADRLQGQQFLQQAQAAIPRSTSFDRKLPDGARCQSPVLHDHPGNPSGTLADGDGPREREGTLERTRSTDAKWHIPSTKILNSLKDKGLQKETSGKDSPNKFSHQNGDRNSSHSSSNTLSSNASSNSDDKHFDSGDLMDPEMLGLTYIKGASTDSGIDTAPCIPPSGLAAMHLAGSRAAQHSRAEQMIQWADHQEDAGPEEEQDKLFSIQSYASAIAAIAASHATEGSIGDLSEISSHSRRLYGDAAEMPMSCQLQTSGRETKHQPSFSKEDFLKLMLPDSPPVEESRRKHYASVPQHSTTQNDTKPWCIKHKNLSSRRSLYRTLSDESLCSNRRGSSYASSRSSMLDQVLPNDILFSTTPPYHSTLPPRMTLNPGASNIRNEFWFSDGSLAEKSKFTDPGLMPLPDTASDLDWSHLVDAARAFEDQRVASFCTMTDMQQAQALQISEALSRQIAEAEGKNIDETGESSPSTLTGKVNQLEVILRQLQYDLRKEKEDKAILKVEVQHLRQDNMRLQEESQTAAAQLRKFTEWFFYTIDKKP